MNELIMTIVSICQIAVAGAYTRLDEIEQTKIMCQSYYSNCFETTKDLVGCMSKREIPKK